MRGTNGEWVENIALVEAPDASTFWEHYENQYSGLFTAAKGFIEATGAKPGEVMVFMT